MSRLLPFAALALAFALTGCRTPIVNATITNNTGAAIRVLEVDYPKASFGTSTLAPGASFHYGFVIQDPGDISVSYSDLGGRDHKSKGPAVDKGQEGDLLVVLNSDSVAWSPHLSAGR